MPWPGLHPGWLPGGQLGAQVVMSCRERQWYCNSAAAQQQRLRRLQQQVAAEAGKQWQLQPFPGPPAASQA